MHLDSLTQMQFILYPSISNSLLSMFYCVPLEDGTAWLRVDLSLQCVDASGTTVARRAAMIAFTLVMIVLHTVGTPAVYTYLLFWKHKSALDALKEQELNDHYLTKLEELKIGGPHIHGTVRVWPRAVSGVKAPCKTHHVPCAW